MVHSYHVVLSAREHVDKERNHEGFPEKALTVFRIQSGPLLPIDFEIKVTSKVDMRILLIACNLMNEGILVCIGFSCMLRTSVNAVK